MAAAQFGDQHGPQEGKKHLCGGRRRDAHGGHHALAGKRAQDGQPSPVAARRRTPRPRAIEGAGIAAGQRGGDPCLVDKDQVLGVDLSDPFAKDRPFLLDVGTILLASAQRLFLRRSRAAAARGTGSAG
jgi:hypothetical protein